MKFKGKPLLKYCLLLRSLGHNLVNYDVKVSTIVQFFGEKR